MAILITNVLLVSLLYIQQTTAGTCPEKCKSGQICDDADSGCPDCQIAFWGRQCQHPYECKTTTKGLEYAGYRNKTNSGITCQQWASDFPHTHNSKTQPENYCRNPIDWTVPYCYTMDPDKRYEDCGIQFCNTHCPVPSLKVFGDIPNPPSTGFQVGVTVSIIADCGPGTRGKRTCTADKTWTDTFDCLTITWCPKPVLKPKSNIIDVKVKYNLNTELDVICDTGYEITGNQSKIKCQVDKTWGTIPSCAPVQCKSPALNEYTTIDQVRDIKITYSFGDIITVRCLTGPSQTTHICGADKTWSGTLPTCLPKTENYSSAYTTGGAVGGVVGFVMGVTIVLIVICIRRRRQSSAPSNNGNIQKVEKDVGQEYISLESDEAKAGKNAYEDIKNDDLDRVYGI